ncbi:sarcosine oxidase subunit gamma [Acuticoccus kandeliae]|uniref:sarcosine oxidase subunit gamma n=1 Tax=Acuticoccus kandeliae TaxID=2073160 RepID=UPI001B3BF9D0|nr:sarcosine oxidase subunit gamma family protein [Acuticoccus kandeliae]
MMDSLADAAGPVALTLSDTGARFSLRVAQADREAAAGAFGLALPAGIGDAVRGADREGLCVGPDEWVLWADEAARGDIVAAFAALAATVPHSLVDISDREMTITLAGPGAADLLAMGIAIDLDAFASGHGVRTVFSGVSVILRRDSADLFRLDVWRSFVPHLWTLLAEGNHELALGV